MKIRYFMYNEFIHIYFINKNKYEHPKHYCLISDPAYKIVSNSILNNGINTKNHETTLYPFVHNQFNTKVHIGAHRSKLTKFHTLDLL